MRKIALILGLFISLPLCAQTAAISGYSTLGGTQAKTQGLNSTNYLQGIIPHATITVLLTGTQTKATIYSNGSNTPLSNPFTSNDSSSSNPGGWVFWASTTQAYDIVASGGIPPNTYPSPVPICVDCFPGNQVSFCLNGCTLTGQLNSTYTGTDTFFGGITAANILAPNVGNIILADGWSAGVNAGAWSSATTYPSCNVVSYSGKTYVSTETTNNILPGTGDSANAGAHAYDWLLVRSDGVTYTPAGWMCADYVLIGNGERATIGTGKNGGTNYTLLFGSGTYTATSGAFFISDPAPMFNGIAAPNRITVNPAGMGKSSTHIVAAGSWPAYTTSTSVIPGYTIPTSFPTGLIESPIQAGASVGGPNYAPKVYSLVGIDVNANQIAPYAIDLKGFAINGYIADVQYEQGTVGNARLGVDSSNTDTWISSPTIVGFTDNTQDEVVGGAFLTVSISGGVPTVGFGVQIASSSLGSGYPTTGTEPCTVNGGTFTAQATCSATANGFGGVAIAITSAGTYSTAPTSISFTSFGSGSGAGATPAISSGSGYPANTQVVLQGTQGGTSPVPCTTMPTASTLYPEGSVTPTLSGGGAITLTGWQTTTGASGCVGPMMAWASSVYPVAIGTDFNWVSDFTHGGGLFGTSGAACTYRFMHGNNKISGIHWQGGGQYGLCNYNNNTIDGFNAGEQRQGSIFTTTPIQVDHGSVGYTISFPYHAFITQVEFAANTGTVNGTAVNGTSIRDTICYSNPVSRNNLEYHSILNYASSGTTILSQTSGSGYAGPGYVVVSGGSPVNPNTIAIISVSVDSSGALHFSNNQPGSYLPGSATPTISLAGFTSGSGASATLQLQSPNFQIWDSPADTFPSDVHNLAYCGPFGSGSTIESTAAPATFNGIVNPITQTINTRTLGVTGSVGYNPQITQTTVNTTDNGDGIISGSWTILANSASSQLTSRLGSLFTSNQLTGGGALVNGYGLNLSLDTIAGTTTSQYFDFFVTDAGRRMLGTVVNRRGYGCDTNANVQGTLSCFRDLSTGTNWTNGAWRADLGFLVNGHQVIPATATGNTGAAAGLVSLVPGAESFGFTTLSAGVSPTISTTAACSPSATCVYKLTNCGNGGTAVGVLEPTSWVSGTSFTITSINPTSGVTQTLDTSHVCWQIN